MKFIYSWFVIASISAIFYGFFNIYWWIPTTSDQIGRDLIIYLFHIIPAIVVGAKSLNHIIK